MLISEILLVKGTVHAISSTALQNSFSCILRGKKSPAQIERLSKAAGESLSLVLSWRSEAEGSFPSCRTAQVLPDGNVKDT